ncbi:hypothetical protein IJI89_01455 [Candidatus Saccharibacteria bacterium]|jgi:hypothetical protein|nr:hypothetical protein [Candidatus Saccharibacteria bacterium]
MAQAKKKTATKTAKKQTVARKSGRKQYLRYERYDKNQSSNMIFVIGMSFLAATLLFADLLMMTA